MESTVYKTNIYFVPKEVDVKDSRPYLPALGATLAVLFHRLVFHHGHGAIILASVLVQFDMLNRRETKACKNDDYFSAKGGGLE